MISREHAREILRGRLANLIREVSALHGGEPEFDKHTGEVLGEDFLTEYIAEVIKEWSNDLGAAIACFEDLKAQALTLSRTSRKEPKRESQEKIKGHGAFREHYAELERASSGELMAAQGEKVPR